MDNAPSSSSSFEGPPESVEPHWIRFGLEGTLHETSEWLGSHLDRSKPDRNVFDCLISQDAGSTRRAWEQARSGRPSEFRAQIALGGRLRGAAHISLYLERGGFGAPSGVLALLRFNQEPSASDVPGSESSMLAQALQISPFATALLDSDCQVVWANDAFRFLLGCRRSEVVGHALASLIGGAAPAKAFQADLAARLERSDSFTIETLAQHRSRYQFMMQIEVSPLSGSEDAAARYVAHCSNVDHLRADSSTQSGVDNSSSDRQPERLDSMSNLDRALAALRREVEEIRLESASKTEFLANISHEIRTPMNAVVGFCDLLNSSDLSEEQSEYVQAIYHSGQLLIQLIGQVLDYSKISSGHLELLQEEVDLEHVFLEAQSFMSTRARSKGLKFEVDMSDLSGAYVLGDATRIKQIVVNLLGNAYKFTRRGSIALKVRREASLKPGFARIEASVLDTGIGIDAGRIPHIFTPFAQADARASREYGGSGLGLAISKQLCRAMNGNIWLERTSESGSEFCFELNLPLAREEQRIKEVSVMLRKPVVSEPVLSTHRILVVDDNPNNLLITLKLSEHLGYEATAVRSGVEALEALRAREYSIILMDVRMAPINGMETTQRIREGDAGDSSSEAYIIALTAHALQGDRDRCLESGMNDYLSKPLTLEMLSGALKRAEHSLAS